jgi:hypothetical protein
MSATPASDCTAVVEEEGDAPPLILLRGEDLLGRLAVGCDDRLGVGAGR